MEGPTSPNQSARTSAPRRYGPEVDEPPPLVDPRRWGSMIGLIGGLVFIGSYSSVLGSTASTVAWVAGVALVLAALFAHYVRPVSLGPLTRPHPLAVAALYGRRAAAKDAGVSPDGTGSHRMAIGSDAEPFTDPDGFAWETAPA